jgi:CDP-diacylglycerol--serine O-phosphatidyltransferase
MRKQIPNFITLLNLVAGCFAIIFTLEPGLDVVMDENGVFLYQQSEALVWASACIGIAAVVDFFDGFIARALGASSEMGGQLDSLADVVSFGVAPGMIAYHFLKLSWSYQTEGIETSVWAMLPALLIPCAGAFRLARFNTVVVTSGHFQGVPIPAAGLFVASMPVIFRMSTLPGVYETLLNVWVWYAIVAIMAFLMVTRWPILSFKFSHFRWKGNELRFAMIIIAIVLMATLRWASVPFIFLAYVLISVIALKKSETIFKFPEL